MKQDLEIKGYCILDVLNKEDVVYLNSLCEKYLGNQNGEFIASSHILNKIDSDFINGELKRLLKAKIENVFPELELLGGTLATKRHGNNNLDVHRDWTIVDEPKYTSYNLWIALVDTNSENGTLGLIEGSHLNCSEVRGHKIPNPYLKETDSYIKRGTEPLLNAGQAILYDHRLLHYSRPNRTKYNRNVAIVGVKPKEANLQVSILVSKDKIETYQVTQDDFYRFDDEKIRKLNNRIR
ncbi:MAG: phytanoyl-CoA dioxygenase family protein [Chitinophagales bacterium]